MGSTSGIAKSMNKVTHWSLHDDLHSGEVELFELTKDFAEGKGYWSKFLNLSAKLMAWPLEKIVAPRIGPLA